MVQASCGVFTATTEILVTTVRPPPGSAERIIGRAELVARLGEVLAPGAGGTVLLVGGEAGVGKTRIAREAAMGAGATGRTVMQGNAAPVEPVLPFGVFQDALRTERRREAAPPAMDDPLARQFRRMLLPELGGPADVVDRGVLFEVASAYVRERARGAGLLLVLEDLHWADPTSVELVHYLARTAVDPSAVIVATYRLDDAPVELTTLRRRVLGDRLGEEHVLEGLRPDEVGELVEVVLGRKCDAAFTQAVVRSSEGNPFVVEELVRHATLEGHLDAATGAWKGDLPDALPWGVREMQSAPGASATTTARSCAGPPSWGRRSTSGCCRASAVRRRRCSSRRWIACRHRGCCAS